MFQVVRDPIEHIGVEKTPRSTYNIQGCMGTGVLCILRVRVWVRIWVQQFFYNRGQGYLGMSNFIFNYTFIFVENLNL